VHGSGASRELGRLNASGVIGRASHLRHLEAPLGAATDERLKQPVEVGLGCLYKHAPIAANSDRPLTA
jgi:hypothetical protein